MDIDFSKLKTSDNKKIILSPRDIFMSLPKKDEKKYKYPRDVQTEVWNQWLEKRDSKNLIIKMNTGSGKTVVGLLILQSCLNEKKGPAVYVVPDKFLVSQVCSEASKLGIKVTIDENDYFFKNSKAILVTNIYKLINGKSVFGMREFGNINIGSIIIDDIHACLDTIEQQYTVNIDNSNESYSKILDIFKQEYDLKKSQIFYDITEIKDPKNNKLIPFWIWQKHCEKIRRIIKENKDNPITLYNLPLIEKHWETCNCVVSADKIEITPKSIPISNITSLHNAERRIYMSATLANDSIFVSSMGLKKEDFIIITPEKANDIGERLILFPKHLNADLDDTTIKNKIVEISKTQNVSVIVPSRNRIKFWEDVNNVTNLQILDHTNIEEGITKIKNNVFKGITVFLNKYDGIDLPDDACRFLVLDGLPPMRNEYDIILQDIIPNNKKLYREQIQKIEQGMGRGVRSTTDFCAIVLMGGKLEDVLVNNNGVEFFSSATLKQYELSKNLWELLMDTNPKPSIDDIFDITNYMLQRDATWIGTVKEELNDVEYEKEAKVDDITVSIRNAFEKEEIKDYEAAFSIIEEEKNKQQNNDIKGYLMQLMAEYKNFKDSTSAQELLKAGLKFNRMILKPKDISCNNLLKNNNSQITNIKKEIEKYSSFDNYLIHVESVIGDLNFISFECNDKKEYTNNFEQAINDIAKIIGIGASRPEKEDDDGGPDNLWSLDNNEYFIIECKNGVNKNIQEISKSDCSQMLSSIVWFEKKYGTKKYYPIMIHRVNILEKHANADENMRILTEERLNDLKNNILSFVKSIVDDHGHLYDDIQIKQRLSNFNLIANQIINKYTISTKKCN